MVLSNGRNIGRDEDYSKGMEEQEEAEVQVKTTDHFMGHSHH